MSQRHPIASGPTSSPSPLSSHSPSALSSPLASRLIGSTTAGVLELLCFHPVDTTAKRLMNSRLMFSTADGGSRAAHINRVVFREHANAGLLVKVGSLFPGLGFAAGYKICQRIYKFGGQPYVNDFLDQRWGPEFISLFGSKHGPSLQQATAGSIIGIGEVLLLPLDVLKIRRQTAVGPAAASPPLLSRPLYGLSELYAGAGWTVARNAPGSFCLFGGAAFTYHSLFQLQSAREATFAQQAAASTVGAAASILISAPLDTIKTRVQAAEWGAGMGGRAMLRQLLRTEGVSALWKGVLPKLAVVGPKLVFSFTIAQFVTTRLAGTQ